jgi:hypothetical protein
MDLKSAYQNFSVNRRYHGIPAAVRVLSTLAVRRFIEYERVFLFYLEEIPDEVRKTNSERTRLASIDEILRLSREPEYDLSGLSSEAIQALYRQGHRCVLNLVEGRVAGYSWLDPVKMEISKLHLRFELFPNEGYIYKGFTHPDFRGRRLGLSRYIFWLDYLHAIGRNRIVADFAFDNLATLSRVEKLKMRRVGTATTFGAAGYRSLSLSGEFQRRRGEPI